MSTMTETETTPVVLPPEIPPPGPAPVAAVSLEDVNEPDGPLHKPSAKITKVSIVIPVYNEEATVQILVALVVKARLPEGVTREIICVNDCSKDKTAQKLDQLPKLFPEVDFKIVHKPVNEGKGAALRDGFKLAGGDCILVQD